MKTLQSGLVAAVLAATFALPGTFPTNRASAAPLFIPKTATAQSDVIQVRNGWYNGYRGYPYYRHGYHYYNGWWFPAGAFLAGALIGGALAYPGYYGGGYYPGYYGGGYYPSYYGGYYGGGYYPRYYGGYYGGGYYPRYYARRYYAHRYYYPRAYHHGFHAYYHNDITCTHRLSAAGMC